MKYLLTGEESQRLKFRLLAHEDYDTWLEFFKTSDSAKFLGLGKIPTPEKQCEEWFKICMNRYEKDIGGMNVLIDKTSNEFIGQCGLLVQDVDNKKELEIGYSIIPKFWNLGYASEASQKCRDFAFQNNFTESIISIVHVDNIKSKKVALKNGMKLDKTTTYKEMPVNVFKIWKEEWLNVTN